MASFSAVMAHFVHSLTSPLVTMTIFSALALGMVLNLWAFLWIDTLFTEQFKVFKVPLITALHWLALLDALHTSMALSSVNLMFSSTCFSATSSLVQTIIRSHSRLSKHSSQNIRKLAISFIRHKKSPNFRLVPGHTSTSLVDPR